MLAVKEDHHPTTIAEIKNTLVAVDSDTKTVYSLDIQGAPDFVTYPRFSHDGKTVSWVQFWFPNMPWDFTELWIADWRDGKIENARPVAGHGHKASVTQPVWSPDGSLFFVDDRTGWWQLYRMRPNGEVQHIAIPGLEKAEFADCDWWLGSQKYSPLGENGDKVFAFYSKDGYCNAIEVDVTSFASKDLGCPIVEVSFNSVKVVNGNMVAVIGASLTRPQSLFLVDIDRASSPQLLKSSSEVELPQAFAGKPQSITFPCSKETGGGHAHALYYPPTNPDFQVNVSMPPYASMSDSTLGTRGVATASVSAPGDVC